MLRFAGRSEKYRHHEPARPKMKQPHECRHDSVANSSAIFSSSHTMFVGLVSSEQRATFTSLRRDHGKDASSARHSCSLEVKPLLRT